MQKHYQNQTPPFISLSFKEILSVYNPENPTECFNDVQLVRHHYNMILDTKEDLPDDAPDVLEFLERLRDLTKSLLIVNTNSEIKLVNGFAYHHEGTTIPMKPIIDFIGFYGLVNITLSLKTLSEYLLDSLYNDNIDSYKKCIKTVNNWSYFFASLS